MLDCYAYLCCDADHIICKCINILLKVHLEVEDFKQMLKGKRAVLLVVCFSFKCDFSHVRHGIVLLSVRISVEV